MIYTNFKLPADIEGGWDIYFSEYFSVGWSTFFDLFKNRRKLSALLVANPSAKILFFLALMRVIGLMPYPVFIFDLILKCPQSYVEKLIARAKGVCVRLLDFVIVIHKDTSGYEFYYGIKHEQFIYVPFKANNFDFRDEIEVANGDYVVALGASQRDYRTLISAATRIKDKVLIVCSDEKAIGNNADVGEDALYPPNVKRIRENIDSKAWYGYMAGAKFVVVPISSSAIQPAGISVYLEAMILKKAVIVSEGASSNFILQDGINALLVPPGNPNKLADAVNRLSVDAELRETLSVAGSEYALSLGNDRNLRHNILKAINAILSPASH